MLEKTILDILQQGDIVVIANRYISNFQKNPNSDYDWMENKQSVERVNLFNERVISRGARTILFLPTPEYNVQPEECKPMWFRPIVSADCAKSVKETRSQYSPSYSLVDMYLDKSILIYDPLPAMCQAGKCSMFDKHSKPLYVDDDHISDYANRYYIYPDFINFLSKNYITKQTFAN